MLGISVYDEDGDLATPWRDCWTQDHRGVKSVWVTILDAPIGYTRAHVQSIRIVQKLVTFAFARGLGVLPLGRDLDSSTKTTTDQSTRERFIRQDLIKRV